MLNAENLRDAEQRRFAWRCRRGMLELDIVLQDFVDKQFNALNLEELQAFDAMLAMPDNDFWALINGSEDLKKQEEQKLDAKSALIHKIKSVRHTHKQEAE